MPGNFESPAYRADLNGLTLLLKESDAFPIVALDFLVQVGAKEEGPNHAGAAHFTEHLLFRPQDGNMAADPAKRLQRVGADINGYTTHDFTCYSVTIASRYLDLAIEVLAELLTSPRFREEDFETERKIILKEIALCENDPYHNLEQAGRARIFMDHPYGRGVYGTSRSVRRMHAQDIVQFFRSNYCREKIIVAAVGNFDTPSFLTSLKKSLRAIPSISPAPPSFSTLPRKPKPGELFIWRNLKASSLELLFPAVPLSHRDYVALSVLALILGGSRVSRTFWELQENRSLVHSISAQPVALKLAGFFGISATFEPGRERAVRQALQEQIQRLQSEPITEDELALARAKVEASAIFKNETVVTQSFALVYFACLAHPEYEQEFLRLARQIRREDLQRVARQYLDEKSQVEILSGPFRPRALAAPMSQGASQPREIPPAFPEIHPASFTVVEGNDAIKKIMLSNHATLLLCENHDLPVVSVAAFIRTGSRHDPPGKSGLASLTHDLLLRRTRAYSSFSLSYAIESLGAELSGYPSLDTTQVDIHGLSRDFPKLVSMLAEILLHPEFNTEELEKIRSEVLLEIQSEEDKVGETSYRMLTEAIFDKHPYGQHPLGTIESVRALTVEDLFRFYSQHYRGENLVLSVAGDIAWERAAGLIAGAFQNLPAERGFTAPEDVLPPLPDVKKLLLKQTWATTGIILSYRLPPLVHPDYPALQVLAVILGGPFSSRLWQELRDRRGLVYSTGSEIVSAFDAGIFSVSAVTNKKDLQQVTRIIFEQIDDLQNRDCSYEEVEHAKRYVIGSHELSHQGPCAWAGLLGNFEISGMGWRYDSLYPRLIENVTPQEVRKAARSYLTMDRYVLLTIKPKGLFERLWSSLIGRGFAEAKIHCKHSRFC